VAVLQTKKLIIKNVKRVERNNRLLIKCAKRRFKKTRGIVEKVNGMELKFESYEIARKARITVLKKILNLKKNTLY
jgi:hypothetical protein